MRLVGSEQYGQFSFLIAQCNLIVALGFGWLNQAQLRYYTIDRNQKFYKENQLRSILNSAIFCALVFFIFGIYQTLTIQIWIVSIITIILIGLFNYIKTYYQAKLLPDKIILLTIVQSFLGLLFPVVTIFILGPNKLSLILGIALSFLLGITILLKEDIKKIFSVLININKTIINANHIKKWFIYGSPLSVWFAMGLALTFLDRFFINHYLTNEELGVYASLQELLIRSFSLTLFPLTLALHPRIMSLWNAAKVKDASKLIIQSMILMLCLGGIILFIFWQFNDHIFIGIQKAIPQISHQSKILIMPLFCAGFLWQLSFLTHKMLELKEQTIFMVISFVPSLIINIIGNSLLLPKLGGIATAYTSFFSALVYCLITGIHFIYSLNKIHEL